MSSTLPDADAFPALPPVVSDVVSGLIVLALSWLAAWAVRRWTRFRTG